MDIHNILNELSKLRPVFHSEADFQFALAWHIQQALPNSDVRLEYCNNKEDVRYYLDIRIKDHDSSEVYGIELKYKTKKCDIVCGEEFFRLKEHNAYDQACYDYLKDIQRLEAMIDSGLINIGYAVFLTNAPHYWEAPKRASTFDADFRIYENRSVPANSLLKWSGCPAEGTTRSRNASITLRNQFQIKWSDYYNNGQDVFKYIGLMIT